MKLENQIGQQFIIGVAGTELTDNESRWIVENRIGGVILFDRNFHNPDQTHDLIQSLKRLSKKMEDKTPLFISVDMEGGPVHRLKEPFTQWPAIRCLGEINSKDQAHRFSHLMGKELRAVGFNLNYAPCVDVLQNPENQVIGRRSLSPDPEIVGALASSMVKGHRKAGILSCAKHFPGHGFTSVDSHLDLPIDERTWEDLRTDIKPFQKVIQADVDSIMMAHIQYPQIDDKYPASLSPIFVSHILKKKLKFQGLIIADDLDMGALSRNYPLEEIPILALKAGVHILLYCNKPKSHIKAFEKIKESLAQGQLDPQIIEKNYKTIVQFKRQRLKHIESEKWEKAKGCIGCLDHRQFSNFLTRNNNSHL